MSTPSFDRALQNLLGMEGGYVDHPADPGGKTRYGVTEAVARKHGYTGSMRSFPLDLAVKIYAQDYWNPFDLDTIPSHEVAELLFDMAVNMGGRGMALVAQRAVSYRVPIAVDGAWGPQTLGAVRSLASRYEDNLLGALKGERWRYYLGIIQRKPSSRAFIWGWAKRCV